MQQQPAMGIKNHQCRQPSSWRFPKIAPDNLVPEQNFFSSPVAGLNPHRAGLEFRRLRYRVTHIYW